MSSMKSLPLLLWLRPRWNYRLLRVLRSTAIIKIVEAQIMVVDRSRLNNSLPLSAINNHPWQVLQSDPVMRQQTSSSDASASQQ
ncbi:hypothetical protein Acr_22g0007300 [Actinidia rufa]|uniref:Uncharacterized protein n=1 Tax=Actinidia rufa TaxID=165716 RepID=A0A7J0GKN4_9ERIC|nr:hypothetical protein Acr_22g0007300 [Actinidia rufa]